MRLLFCFAVALALPLLNGGAALAGCPPHSSARYETGNVVHCRCNAGYENRGGACRPVPSLRAKRQPSMRAMTRAECVRVAGEQLRKALGQCKSPLVHCLTSAGVRIHEATCAASTLVSALVLAADPTKVSAAVAGPAVAGAVVACGREAYDAVEKCSPDWGTCQAAPLRAHKAALNACRGL